MCYQINTLSKNECGQLAHCTNCDVYHLYFNNIFLEFTKGELKAFQHFVSEIDVDFWESCCQRALLKRRIPVQTMQQNLAMVFDQQELESLKDLIFERTKKPDTPLRVCEIEYRQFLN